MNASSGSGLCPTRINCFVADKIGVPHASGRYSHDKCTALAPREVITSQIHLAERDEYTRPATRRPHLLHAERLNRMASNEARPALQRWHRCLACRTKAATSGARSRAA